MLKDELARDLTCDRQQLLWQKHVTVIDFINLDSEIDERPTGLVQCWRADWLTPWPAFYSNSFFFVATSACSRSFCEFFSVAKTSFSDQCTCIWCVERWICGWYSWLNTTSSNTVVFRVVFFVLLLVLTLIHCIVRICILCAALDVLIK